MISIPSRAKILAEDEQRQQQQSSETLRDFLNRRKRELNAQLAALRGMLLPIERELKEIDIAIEALPPAPIGAAPALHGLLSPSLPPSTSNALLSSTSNALLSGGALVHDRFKSMTIKELVVQSLLVAFPSGASSAQIRNFIRDAYGRDIEPASLRPQLHRLKVDGKLISVAVTSGSGDIWNLEPKARQLYARYDHPTSRSAMKELQDEPPSVE